MKQRCSNPNDPSYVRYGAKGVTFQDNWSFFENFLSDMGEAPDGCTLDRIDGTKGYSKDNCRWATIKEQNNNKKNNVRPEGFGGKTIAQIAESSGVKEGLIRSRYRSGRTGSDLINPIKNK
jgi:hypothetical protein